VQFLFSFFILILFFLIIATNYKKLLHFFLFFVIVYKKNKGGIMFKFPEENDNKPKIDFLIGFAIGLISFIIAINIF